MDDVMLQTKLFALLDFLGGIVEQISDFCVFVLLLYGFCYITSRLLVGWNKKNEWESFTESVSATMRNIAATVCVITYAMRESVKAWADKRTTRM